MADRTATATMGRPATSVTDTADAANTVGAADIADATVAERRARVPEVRLERHRAELKAHCRRMLGSAFEADDAVQETMVRAWRNVHRFRGHSSLRWWLHRIATNVCLDMLKRRQRTDRPVDPAWAAADPAVASEPGARGSTAQGARDPGETIEAQEQVRLALMATLLHLPARQRAVLILREVLRWQASEVAELLDTSAASVNSALQRARATLAHVSPDSDGRARPVGDQERALLARYVDAFRHDDIDGLVRLLAAHQPPRPTLDQPDVRATRTCGT